MGSEYLSYLTRFESNVIFSSAASIYALFEPAASSYCVTLVNCHKVFSFSSIWRPAHCKSSLEPADSVTLRFKLNSLKSSLSYWFILSMSMYLTLFVAEAAESEHVQRDYSPQTRSRIAILGSFGPPLKAVLVLKKSISPSLAAMPINQPELSPMSESANLPAT